MKTCFQGICRLVSTGLSCCLLHLSAFSCCSLTSFSFRIFFSSPAKHTHARTHTSTATPAAFRHSVVLSRLHCSVPRLVPAPSKKRKTVGEEGDMEVCQFRKHPPPHTEEEKTKTKKQESSLVGKGWKPDSVFCVTKPLLRTEIANFHLLFSIHPDILAGVLRR